jgi:capsular polysaccharide biosynthesis protein
VEISDYLRVIRRRLWILVLVPLLAAGAVAVWVLRQPPQYQATVTVAAPTVLSGTTDGQYSGANAPRAFVADFRAVITSPLIVNKVAEETGAAADDIKDGITAAAIGDSSLVQVTYRTPKREQAGMVAQAAAGDTIRFLFQTQVTLARTTVDEAQKAVDNANAALAKFYKSTGQVLPDEAYRIKAQQVADLQREQASARAAGETTTADALEGTIRDRQAELAKLAPQVATYQGLLDHKQQALARLNLLEEGRERAQAQYNAADPKSVVTLGQVERVSRLAGLLRTAAPAFGAGLVLAVCVVLLLELVGRRPRSESEVPYTATAASPPEPARSRP